MTRTDRLVIALACGTVLASYGLFWQSKDNAGSEVSVWVAGKETLRLPLSENRRVAIRGALGTSFVQIDAGRARVLDSPGPRKLCVRAGWLSRSGESAICLPNQVVVRIEGGQPMYDAINF